VRLGFLAISLRIRAGSASFCQVAAFVSSEPGFGGLQSFEPRQYVDAAELSLRRLQSRPVRKPHSDIESLGPDGFLWLVKYSSDRCDVATILNVYQWCTTFIAFAILHVQAAGSGVNFDGNEFIAIKLSTQC